MSMLKYPLNDFIASVPSCQQTSTLAMVLEMFEQEQCDRLVVVNEQECPLGLLYCARLIPKFLTAVSNERNTRCLDLQQPLSTLDRTLIEPIQTLPASSCVEEFGFLLRSQHQNVKKDTNCEWVLTDSKGKFVGLVDSARLLQLLASSTGDRTPSLRSRKTTRGRQRQATHKASANSRKEYTATSSNSDARARLQSDYQSLIKLLERLPWPLMVQTGSGEVVTQNPAWWQQLGALKDPEGVKQEVETILAPVTSKKPEYSNHKAVSHTSTKVNEDYLQVTSQPLKTHPRENSRSILSETMSHQGLHSQSKSAPPHIKNLKTQLPSEACVPSRCFLDHNFGTCTCVVEVQNGQERIWQFAKIPLDSPELKILNPESEVTPNTDLWLVLATDVTEQQQLCKELAAKNADLIQLNRLKDEFLACISHELKTPLTAVLGLSRLLVDQQLGELNERQARYAGLIHQSGRHLMSVVNDILDLTRMETGQMDLTLNQVEIRTVCDRALAEAKAIHTQTNKSSPNAQSPDGHLREHQFTLSIEPGLADIVADELRLRQMLVHLFSNAFKFTETSGEIGLLVSRWEGWIAFKVWDTGIGIPEHQQHLIFQKFQQLENPLTRQFEGTGLGLVLTRALARLHGGDVSFLSREGKGSQFTLLLPPSPPNTRAGGDGSQCVAVRQSVAEGTSVEGNAARVASLQEVPVREVSPVVTFGVNKGTGKDKTIQNSKFKIQNSKLSPQHLNFPNPQLPHTFTSSQQLVLVVEAVALYIENLTEHLTGLGYRVVIARSGTEAVEKARRLQPKAIFLNPLLPLLSGWDVLTLLKSDEVTRHIPVIVTATRAEKDQAFANQSDGFLSLPVQHQVLAPLLEKFCATPEIQRQNLGADTTATHKTSLRILRLVNPEFASLNSLPVLREHRVVESDDLDQAELLARVWQFDVVLLDAEISEPQAYLEKLSKHPRLAALPLVTCHVTTTQAASKVAGLCVFPCLIPLTKDKNSQIRTTDPLLSVLQIAAGISCPASILVVDLTILPDLPERKQEQSLSSAKVFNPPCASLGLQPLGVSRPNEWFQALIQYLQTAGFKATKGRSWAELLQQIRHQSVDLLLIYLGENTIPKEVLLALEALQQMPFDLPPVLVLNQQLSQVHVKSQAELSQDKPGKNNKVACESTETVVSAIATEILPRSISMEDLLSHINQALAVNARN